MRIFNCILNGEEGNEAQDTRTLGASVHIQRIGRATLRSRMVIIGKRLCVRLV